MKRTLLKTLFLLLGASTALSAVAYDVQVGDGYYNLDKSKQTAALTYFIFYSAANGAAYTGDLVFPETIEHDGVVYTVTSVDPRTFYACKDLTSVELPSTVTSIGTNAFFNCTGLKSVKLPSKLSMLDYSAFQNCSSLEEIELPTMLTKIDNAVFSGCTALTSVKFSDYLTNIGSSAFYGCSSLKTLDLPRNLTTISPRAFSFCTSLESVVFPDALRAIQTSAFQGCTGLKRLEFGKSLDVLDVNCFADCSQLADVYCNSPHPPSDVYSSDFNGAPLLRLHVPGVSVENYYRQANWSKFQQILPHQCSTPEVRISDHELVIATTTNLNYAAGVSEVYDYSLEVSDLCSGTLTDEELLNFGDLLLTYNVRVKTTAEGCGDSETVAAQLCWLGSEVQLDDKIIDLPSTSVDATTAQRPVLVTNDGGAVTVSGLCDGEHVALYDLSGRQLAAAVAAGGSATLTPAAASASGSVVVLKVAGSSFKIRVN